MEKKQKFTRKITTPLHTHLNNLVNILYVFLPLSSISTSAVTFKTIFRESGIDSYLEGPANKKQALLKGFTKLYQKHEKLPKIILRKVINNTIEYRRYKRNPLKRQELISLSEELFSLGIDMRDEITAIPLDESIPKITVAPTQLIKNLKSHDLDEALLTEPFQLFIDGHFNESVRKAAEIYEADVRERARLDLSGSSLMARAFSTQEYINVEKYVEENRRDFTEGYKLCAMGMMSAIRNTFSHGDEERRSPEECYEMLMLINWLFRYLKSSGA